MSKKIAVCLLVLLLAGGIGHQVKTDWVDTFQERQVAGLWLLLVQRGEFGRAADLVDEMSCRENGFRDFSALENYCEQGFFEGARIEKISVDDRGLFTAQVGLPKHPEYEKLLVGVNSENGIFQIVDFTFVDREPGLWNKVF